MGNNASFLLLDKKRDITSFSALTVVKRVVDRKAGHAGTLDRFARGLLLVFTGSMTHLLPAFSSLDKRYEASIAFGSETDTLDDEGLVVARSPLPTLSAIRRAVDEHFIGEIDQVPPLYSALHVNGARASKLARSGESFTLQSRRVVIHSFDIGEYENGILHCALSVSKGTYIRSIARDLALSMGLRAHLSDLKRVSVGPYRLEEAVGCDDESAILASRIQSADLLLRLPSFRKMEARREAWKAMESGWCDGRLIPLDARSSARYALVYRGEKLRWIVDRKTNKILSRIDE